MKSFDGLGNIIKENAPIGKYTRYGIGGNAEYLISPESFEQLAEVMGVCASNSIPVHVLGYGSNVLVRDEGVKGAVIRLDSPQFTRVSYDGDTVVAGSGTSLNEIVLECVRRGLSGLECMTGIPGSVGGSVRMNAGGRFGDIGTSVVSLKLMDDSGNIYERTKPELAFEYRYSNITEPLILEATFKLFESDPERVMKSTQEIWIYKKNNQPVKGRTAGCIFKNPPGGSAGSLIERAGLKGSSVGGARISDKHANFILAELDSSASDVISLIETAREKVLEQFGIELELELDIWS